MVRVRRGQRRGESTYTFTALGRRRDVGKVGPEVAHEVWWGVRARVGEGGEALIKGKVVVEGSLERGDGVILRVTGGGGLSRVWGVRFFDLHGGGEGGDLLWSRGDDGRSGWRSAEGMVDYFLETMVRLLLVEVCCLAREACGWTRLIIAKPESANLGGDGWTSGGVVGSPGVSGASRAIGGVGGLGNVGVYREMRKWGLGVDMDQTAENETKSSLVSLGFLWSWFLENGGESIAPDGLVDNLVGGSLIC